MTPALLPHLTLKREAYRKGLAAGRRAKYYNDPMRCGAQARFERKYGPLGLALLLDWNEGWRDAALHREGDT